MAINVIAKFQAKAENYKEASEWLASDLYKMSDFKGNLSCFCSGNEETSLITVFQKWESKDDYLAYREMRTKSGELGYLVSLCEGPPEFAFDTVIYERSNE
jgi:quinol monooxygenase YgiN